MTDNKSPCPRCAGQTAFNQWQTTIRTGAPALASLLDLLDAGIAPSFLDVFAGLSEMVAFYTECDPKPNHLVGRPNLESLNKCRFCS